MGNPVQDTRAEALMTQEALAERAGVSVDTIRRAERGESISPLSQVRIARALGVPRDEVFPPQEVSA